MNFAHDFSCLIALPTYMRLKTQGNAHTATFSGWRPNMTRDELNRELRMHSASWQAVAFMYSLIVGTLVLSAMAITA